MIFGTPHKTRDIPVLPVICDGTVIKRASSYKYLGLMLDENLNFSNHVDYIIRKTRGKVKQLGRICHILDQNMSLYLYQSLIVPMFDYVDYVWDALSQNDALSLQRIQNMALKHMLHAHRLTEIVDLHNELKVDPLNVRRFKYSVSMMYRVHHNLVGSAVSNMFTKTDMISVWLIWHNSLLNFYVPRLKLEMSKRNFKYRGVKIWERIVTTMKNLPTLKSFNKAIKTGVG